MVHPLKEEGGVYGTWGPGGRCRTSKAEAGDKSTPSGTCTNVWSLICFKIQCVEFSINSCNSAPSLVQCMQGIQHPVQCRDFSTGTQFSAGNSAPSSVQGIQHPVQCRDFSTQFSAGISAHSPVLGNSAPSSVQGFQHTVQCREFSTQN